MFTLAIVGLLLAILYYYLTSTHDYWTKRGVKHEKPIPLFGTNAKNYLLRANLAQTASETYWKFPNEQLVGYFRGRQPELVVRDLELAKHMLTTDFYSFHRRGFFDTTHIEPLRKQLIVVEDDLWKSLRNRMTPAFSSGKLKKMFPLIVQRAENLQKRLQTIAANRKAVDAKELISRFTNDVIGTVSFGIESDSLNNDNDPMRQIGIRIFALSFARARNQALKSLMPKTFGHLKIFGEVEKDIFALVRKVMKERNYEPSTRHDFLDILLESQKKGPMTAESIMEVNEDGTPKKISLEMDEEIMVAASFVFFGAGFESSSQAMAYTLHEMAHNPDVQEKAQEEIDRVLAQHGNKLCYDAISDMTYLKWSFYESMRMFPISGILHRKSVKPYTFPGTKVTIDGDIPVIIPIEAYHNDPDIFPEPKKFRPERFDPNVMTPEQKMAYMPFGTGPRACIGERFGTMESLAGLAAVLQRYSVRPAPGAPRVPIIDPRSIIGFSMIKGGLPLLFEERRSGSTVMQN